MALTSDSSRTTLYTHSLGTPIGQLHAAVDRAGRVIYLGHVPFSGAHPDVRIEENKYACGELEYQLEQYFAGERNSFSLETRMDGTSFQKTVWSRLSKIGFGETMTYGEVARKIGRRDAARAVGNAVAANPVVLIVPCHRVVPSTGGIGNYARRTLADEEGRRVKRLLLELEKGQRILSV